MRTKINKLHLTPFWIFRWNYSPPPSLLLIYITQLMCLSTCFCFLKQILAEQIKTWTHKTSLFATARPPKKAPKRASSEDETLWVAALLKIDGRWCRRGSPVVLMHLARLQPSVAVQGGAEPSAPGPVCRSCAALGALLHVSRSWRSGFVRQWRVSVSASEVHTELILGET